MSNAQINIEGQSNAGNICGASKKIRITRSKPSILDPHIDNRGWIDFCNKIDGVLSPLDRIQKIMKLTTWFLIIPVIIVIVFVPRSAFLFGTLLLIAILLFQRYKVAKSNKTLDALTNVCDQVNAQHQRLTFSVKSQPYSNPNRRRNHGFSPEITYIEVTISNDDPEIPISSEMPIPMAIAEVIYPDRAQDEIAFQSDNAPTNIKDIDTPTGIYLAESPSAPPEPEDEGNTKNGEIYEKTITERLEELERMKPHISIEEYLEKRTDILSCI